MPTTLLRGPKSEPDNRRRRVLAQTIDYAQTVECQKHLQYEDCVQRSRPFISDLDMDAAGRPLDLAHASLDIITAVLQSMSLVDRFTCALVCKAWAEAATAATNSIILRDSVQDLSCLQHWLQKHGRHLEVLQLHACNDASLTALPCPQLQDLLLHGSPPRGLGISSSAWTGIEAATKLTSVSLTGIQRAPQQTDMVSALTALQDLEQLTLFSDQLQLSDSSLLQQLMQLTALELQLLIAAAALQYLGSLTKLQRLYIYAPHDWAAAGCPGLQELNALTNLNLRGVRDISASVFQLSALQQLNVSEAPPAAVAGLQGLTGVTSLHLVYTMTGPRPSSVPATLQLPELQHLQLAGSMRDIMPMSFLCKCTQLRVLKLWGVAFRGPGSLVASTMLQHIELDGCTLAAADGAAGPVSWQQVFPASVQLPHLTLLEMLQVSPELQPSDIEHVVSSCSSLQALDLDTPLDSFTSALTRLSGLTSLCLHIADDKECSSLAQLTGLRQLRVDFAMDVTAAGLRQLTALSHLTRLDFADKFNPENLSPKLQEQLSDRLPCYPYAIISKAPAGHPPDVSARLLRICDVADDGDS